MENNIEKSFIDILLPEELKPRLKDMVSLAKPLLNNELDTFNRGFQQLALGKAIYQYFLSSPNPYIWETLLNANHASLYEARNNIGQSRPNLFCYAEACYFLGEVSLSIAQWAEIKIMLDRAVTLFDEALNHPSIKDFSKLGFFNYWRRGPERVEDLLIEWDYLERDLEPNKRLGLVLTPISFNAQEFIQWTALYGINRYNMEIGWEMGVKESIESHT